MTIKGLTFAHAIIQHTSVRLHAFLCKSRSQPARPICGPWCNHPGQCKIVRTYKLKKENRVVSLKFGRAALFFAQPQSLRSQRQVFGEGIGRVICAWTEPTESSRSVSQAGGWRSSDQFPLDYLAGRKSRHRSSSGHSQPVFVLFAIPKGHIVHPWNDATLACCARSIFVQERAQTAAQLKLCNASKAILTVGTTWHAEFFLTKSIYRCLRLEGQSEIFNVNRKTENFLWILN